jgi:hypothetical protein
MHQLLLTRYRLMLLVRPGGGGEEGRVGVGWVGWGWVGEGGGWEGGNVQEGRVGQGWVLGVPFRSWGQCT